jgi:hypothetical protein
MRIGAKAHQPVESFTDIFFSQIKIWPRYAQPCRVTITGISLGFFCPLPSSSLIGQRWISRAALPERFLQGY